jgi:hypothetical protein
MLWNDLQEEREDTKGVIRICKSKNKYTMAKNLAILIK